MQVQAGFFLRSDSTSAAERVLRWYFPGHGAGFLVVLSSSSGHSWADAPEGLVVGSWDYGTQVAPHGLES